LLETGECQCPEVFEGEFSFYNLKRILNSAFRL
jgi:hypothetical protein